MAKLLDEPRVPTEIKAVKKKRVKKEPTEPIEVKYTLFQEGDKKNVLKLIELYKEDKFKCRVKFFNSKQKYSFDRLVLFEKGPRDFEISQFTTTFGMSITNRMYSSQKKIMSIVYKDGKFWYVDKRRNRVLPLTFGYLMDFMRTTEHIGYSMRSNQNIEQKSKTFAYLVKKFPFIKVLYEHEYSMGVNLNVVKTKKLTSTKDINRHVFNVPNNIAKLLMESQGLSNARHMAGSSSVAVWKDALKYLDGVQNISQELLNSHYFWDTVKMAKTLGRKVNCRWNAKRLKEEHDKWSREIGYIVLDCEPEFPLNIRKHFLALAEYTGWKLLMTNKEMIIEGMTQDHCVGTYIDRVNNGSCAIFHVDGYTLQVGVEEKEERSAIQAMIKMVIEKSINLSYDNEGNMKEVDTSDILEALRQREAQLEGSGRRRFFKNMQFRGKHNCDPPKELVEMVANKMAQFTLDGKFEELDAKEEAEKKEGGKEMLERKTNGWAKADGFDGGEYEEMDMDEMRLFDELANDNNLPF